MKVSFRLPDERRIVVYDVSDFQTESGGRTRLFMNTYEEVIIAGELLGAVDEQRIPTEDKEVERMELADSVFESVEELVEEHSTYMTVEST